MANPTKHELIMQEHPDFAEWVVKSHTSKNLDMLLTLYLTGTPAKAIRAMQHMFPDEGKKNG